MAFTARVGYRSGALHLGVDVTDDQVTPADLLLVSLHFPGAGTTATGFTYRFGLDGKRADSSGDAPPEFAQALVTSAAQRTRKGAVFEASFPARALPRFPAQEPLQLELCIAYEDRDAAGGPATLASNCEGGSMAGGRLVIPDELRRELRLKPPAKVEGLEARARGWVGYATLHYPVWVSAGEPLTASLVRELAADALVDPQAARIPVPTHLALPDGRVLVGVLSGKDPFARDECDPEAEVRVALYAVQERTALRVLEWPAATCALGRAVSFSLEKDGTLSIGYSNGATTQFVWSTDHFEQTQYGKR